MCFRRGRFTDGYLAENAGEMLERRVWWRRRRLKCLALCVYEPGSVQHCQGVGRTRAGGHQGRPCRGWRALSEGRATQPRNGRINFTKVFDRLSHKFSVVIERDTEGYYVASVPSLPGCHTQAKSLDRLMQRITDAIALYLKSKAKPLPTSTLSACSKWWSSDDFAAGFNGEEGDCGLEEGRLSGASGQIESPLLASPRRTDDAGSGSRGGNHRARTDAENPARLPNDARGICCVPMTLGGAECSGSAGLIHSSNAATAEGSKSTKYTKKGVVGSSRLPLPMPSFLLARRRLDERLRRRHPVEPTRHVGWPPVPGTSPDCALLARSRRRIHPAITAVGQQFAGLDVVGQATSPGFRSISRCFSSGCSIGKTTSTRRLRLRSIQSAEPM